MDKKIIQLDRIKDIVHSVALENANRYNAIALATITESSKVCKDEQQRRTMANSDIIVDSSRYGRAQGLDVMHSLVADVSARIALLADAKTGISPKIIYSFRRNHSGELRDRVHAFDQVSLKRKLKRTAFEDEFMKIPFAGQTFNFDSEGHRNQLVPLCFSLGLTVLEGNSNDLLKEIGTAVDDFLKSLKS